MDNMATEGSVALKTTAAELEYALDNLQVRAKGRLIVSARRQ